MMPEKEGNGEAATERSETGLCGGDLVDPALSGAGKGGVVVWIYPPPCPPVALDLLRGRRARGQSVDSSSSPTAFHCRLRRFRSHSPRSRPSESDPPARGFGDVGYGVEVFGGGVFGSVGEGGGVVFGGGGEGVGELLGDRGPDRRYGEMEGGLRAVAEGGSVCWRCWAPALT